MDNLIVFQVVGNGKLQLKHASLMRIALLGILDQNRKINLNSLYKLECLLNVFLSFFCRQFLVRVPEDLSKQMNPVGSIRRF